jgi:hypothetical protein
MEWLLVVLFLSGWDNSLLSTMTIPGYVSEHECRQHGEALAKLSHRIRDGQAHWRCLQRSTTSTPAVFREHLLDHP